VVHERVCAPLGMRDTGFSVGAGQMDRFGDCHGVDPSTGEGIVYDGAGGQWAAPPTFASGGDGLVSTVADYLAFGRMLLGGGALDGARVLSRPTVAAMTGDQLPGERAAGLDPAGARGWGFGVDVHRRRMDVFAPGTYGWGGGLGTSWANDPAEELVGVVMTNQMWTSSTPPPICLDFWTATYAAFAD
jgi:CubicO group peptidase (beta-lactamase class C family)